MIPFCHPIITEREEELVRQVLDSGFLNCGPMVARLEQMIAGATHSKYAVCTTSGTASITMGLMAYGIGRGHKVAVPSFTYIATAHAVRMTGADVVYVDVLPDSLTIDADQIRDVDAVVSVDLNGRPCVGLESLLVPVVRDACEAFPSTSPHVSCYSFTPQKRIITGQGGAVTTDSPRIAARLVELRQQGSRGFNFKMTDLQAAVGVAQMERLNEKIDHDRKVQNLYADILGHDRPEDLLQWYDIRDVPERTLKKLGGVEYRPFWEPLHPVKAPISGIWLPSGEGTLLEQVRYIAELIVEN